MKEAVNSAPGSAVKILNATWRDLRGLYTLEKACFKQDSWPLWDILGVLTFPEIIRLKADMDDQLVGFIAGDLRQSQHTAWIATFGVLPAYRRRGIGSRLLKTCESRLTVPSLRLSVRASNQPAIQLYQEHGYSQINTWPHYYRGNEDALIFEKHL